MFSKTKRGQTPMLISHTMQEPLFKFPKKHDVVSNNLNQNKEAGWQLQLFKLKIKYLIFFHKNCRVGVTFALLKEK